MSESAGQEKGTEGPVSDKSEFPGWQLPPNWFTGAKCIRQEDYFSNEDGPIG